MEAGRDELARFFATVMPHLNEVQRRMVAGAMATALGRGGKSAVADASGMSRNTVIKAEREVQAGVEPSVRQRAVGGGDMKAEVKQPGLLEALDELVNPSTRGNPMSKLRWTSKSTANLAEDLVRQGFKITDDTVGRIVKSLGYSLQAPSKQKEGAAHPDRDAQFCYLNDQVNAFMDSLDPVISVDTKKKELVGEFSNGGREYHPIGEPTRTKTHDFVDKQLGRAVPYRVYDLANDEGWVSVGDTADTSTFAGCRQLYVGEKCDFHPFVGNNDHLHVVSVGRTSFTLTLEVTTWCQFGWGGHVCVSGDPPGSTIRFDIRQYTASLFGINACSEDVLSQVANSPGASFVTNLFGPLEAAVTWQQQARNLSTALGGTASDVGLIVGTGWSTNP